MNISKWLFGLSILITLGGVTAASQWPAKPPVDPPHDPFDSTSVTPPRIEVVFVLDTTGSMSGLIQAAKEKIWSIASTMANAQPAPELHVGLVAYRDRGDDYVTQVTQLSSDLDGVYAQLMQFQAGGGGDTPESVNAALADAVHKAGWSQREDVYRVVFLVGDAPPHMDYQDEPTYEEVVRLASQRGMVVNTIRCGNSPATEAVWLAIAGMAQGEYFSVGQDGDAIALSTPFDAELAELSKKIDDTRLAYGDAVVHSAAAEKKEVIEEVHVGASVATRARRAAFNAIESGKENAYGKNDLIELIKQKAVQVTELNVDLLPPSLQALPEEERVEAVQAQMDRREQLSAEIKRLSAERDAYIVEQSADLEGLEDSLDYKLAETVTRQAGERGLKYESSRPKL